MRFRQFVGVACAFTFASLAQAAPITFGFTGSVTQIPADDPGGGIVFGSSFSGQYTFDGAALDGVGDASQGSYASFGPQYGLSLQVGANSYSLSGFLNVGVSNDVLGVDQYAVFALDGALSVSLLLEDLGGTVFSSDALPATPPLLGGFALRSLHLVDSALGDVQIDGELVSLDCLQGCAAAPEPSTLVLFGAALLAGASRRRQIR